MTKLSELKAKWEKECVDNKLASGYTFFGLHASHLDELILEAFKLGQDDTAKQIFDEAIEIIMIPAKTDEMWDKRSKKIYESGMKDGQIMLIENLKKRWVK